MQSAENIVSIKLVKKTSGIYENNTDVKYDALYEVDDIKSFLSDFYDIEFNTYLFGDFKALVRAAEIMCRQYAIVATNPPYLNLR